MPLFNADNRRLYRCTVLPGLLVAIICGGSPSDAQELIPRSTQRAEAGQRPQLDRRNPFLDDRLHQTTLTASAPTLDRLHAPLLRRDLKIQAAQSCASASCHAGPRPGVTQPSIKRGARFAATRVSQ